MAVTSSSPSAYVTVDGHRRRRRWGRRDPAVALADDVRGQVGDGVAQRDVGAGGRCGDHQLVVAVHAAATGELADHVAGAIVGEPGVDPGFGAVEVDDGGGLPVERAPRQLRMGAAEQQDVGDDTGAGDLLVGAVGQPDRRQQIPRLVQGATGSGVAGVHRVTRRDQAHQPARFHQPEGFESEVVVDASAVPG